MSYKDRNKQQAYQAGYLAGKRMTWLQDHGPCAQCGSWDRLELDHIDPAQKVTHRVWSLAKPARDAELAKCQVLCSRCHKEKHRLLTAKPLVHGTSNGYQKHRCRCDACRTANNVRVRRWKSKQKPQEGTAA